MVSRRVFLAGAVGLGAVAVAGCDGEEPSGPPAGSPEESPAASPTTATPGALTPTVAGTVASGLNVPWGIAFLSDGDALVSQRDAGSIVRISPDGEVREIGTVKSSVGVPGGEGGLLGLALDPGDDSVLFAYVTTSRDNRVVRMQLRSSGLSDPEPVLTGIPVGPNHHGGRLLFDPRGNLFVSTGEAGNAPLAQDLDSLGGKILRVTRDGKPAMRNPFDSPVWSYGHRNVEGLAFDGNGLLWASEFGSDAVDELNQVSAGDNFGWPRVEGESAQDGLVSPEVTWPVDECSPAGLAITRSTAFVPALQGECLYAVPLQDGRAGSPRRFFEGEYGRIRTVVVAPDDSLWMTTSNTDGRGQPGAQDDRILRVTL